MNPCQHCAGFFFFLFFDVASFAKYNRVLRRYKISGKKKKKKFVNGFWQGLIEDVQTARIYLEERRGHFDFYAESMCNLRSCLVLT